MSADQNLAELKKEETAITTVRKALESMMPQFGFVLPKHITPERLCRVALTAIKQTPKLLDCDRQSLYSAVMRAAQLGLEPDGILGQAYLIPYGKQVQFIVGYKGLIDLARRSGDVSNIIAREVCEKDEFTVDFSQDIPFTHKPLLSGDRGKVTHFWAMARFKDGGFHWDYLSVSEILAIRDASTGYKAAVTWSTHSNNKKTKGLIISPWEQNFIEMGKKTAIRRISKYLPMSVQKATITEDLIDAGKSFSSDAFGDIIIDGESELLNDEVGNDNETGVISESPKGNKLDAFAKTVVQPNPEPTPEQTPHNPETGEILENAASEPEEKVNTVPEFDIEAHNLNTQGGAKQANNAMCAWLATLPQEERGAAFAANSGMMVVAALNRQGVGRETAKIEALGVVLPKGGVA